MTSFNLNDLFVAVDLSSPSPVRLFLTPRSVAQKAPLSIGFPRKNMGMGSHFLL